MSKWTQENGVILYRGPSLLDGAPIIACGGLQGKARADTVIVAHGPAKLVNAYAAYRAAI